MAKADRPRVKQYFTEKKKCMRVRRRILFLIHDLGPGGAEKVLVNLVNNMDHTQFDITVMSLFDEGINRQFLSPKVTYKYCFKKMIRGNSHLMKLLSPQTLHRWLIKDHYDVEIAYLEGPCARVISGCTDKTTKKTAWIHIEQKGEKHTASSFRSVKEAADCYNRFDTLVGVSENVKASFLAALPVRTPMQVLHNTNESTKIQTMAKEPIEADLFSRSELNLIGVGKLLKNKGFYRLIPIVQKLRDEGLPAHLYILGTGPMEKELKELAQQHGVDDAVTLLGYQTNPYKYVAKSDLFVCASFAEGFSTAATEALIVGTPVCTVEVSGMKEMLGEDNEWGVVTENDDEALYRGVKRLLDEPALLAHYKEKAAERGKIFRTEKTVQATEEMLKELMGNELD